MRELIQSVHLGLGAIEPAQGLHHRRGPHALGGGVEHAAEDARGAARRTSCSCSRPPTRTRCCRRSGRARSTSSSRCSRAEQLIGHLADILGREGVEADAEVLDLVARRAGRFRARRAVGARPGARGRRRSARRRRGAGRARRRAVRAAARRARSGRGRRRRRRARRRPRPARRRATTSAASPTTCCARCATRSWPPTRTAGFRTTARAEEAAQLAALAQAMGNVALVRAIEILGQAIVDIRQQTVADPRLVLEVAVVRLARREARTSVETLLDRVERLERQLARGGGAAPAAQPAPIAPRRRPTVGRAARAGCPAAMRRAACRDAEGRAAPEPAPPDEPRPRRTGDRLSRRPRPTIFDPDDVIEAWPNGARVAEGAAARGDPTRAADRRRSRASSCSACPAKRFDAINGRFRSEADTHQGRVRGAARLPAAVRAAAARLRRARRVASGVGRRSAAAAARSDAVDEPTTKRRSTSTELVDADDAPPPDSVARLVSDLGAEVVEERPRD